MPDADLRPERRALRAGRRDGGRLAVPGDHNALQRRRGARGAAGRGRRRGRGRRVAGELPRARAGASRCSGRTAAGRDRRGRLRAPPDRGRGDDRGRAHAAARGAWSRSSSPTSSRARACSRASSASRSPRPTSPRCVDVYPARERAEDFPGTSGLTLAEATADAAGGRPVLWLPAFDDAERALRGLLARRGPPARHGGGGRRRARPPARRRLEPRRGRAVAAGSAAAPSNAVVMPPSLALPRRTLAAPRLRPPRLRVVLVALAVAALLGGGWLWLRQSSLVAVRQVTVTGASGPQGARIAARAGGGRPRHDDPRRPHRGAPAGGRAVPGRRRGQRRRLAARTGCGSSSTSACRSPSSSSRARASASPPTAPSCAATPVDRVPTWPWAGPPPARISTTARRRAVALLAAAPPRLRARVARLELGSKGWIAPLRDGPLLVFGDADAGRGEVGRRGRRARRPALGRRHLRRPAPSRAPRGRRRALAPSATASPSTSG